MPDLTPKNSFNARETLQVGGQKAYYYRLAALEEAGLGTMAKLPFSIKVLLESLFATKTVTMSAIKTSKT